ncbi:hypothetical protein AVEN_16150-1 [Araneus ventricosus]|uniref:Uncharacterized protein n=1 Tax=Araneus ventricosus TaxID=182803 RepID=A0A4Y2JCV7_ARAVE|nr:hypothetical protein AVEN_16150-1 [Araneus ventricosus]
MTAAAIVSSTEAGVQVANHLATAQPLPKEVHAITGGGAQSSTITIPTREASSCLLTIPIPEMAPFQTNLLSPLALLKDVS